MFQNTTPLFVPFVTTANGLGVCKVWRQWFITRSLCVGEANLGAFTKNFMFTIFLVNCSSASLRLEDVDMQTTYDFVPLGAFFYL
jgi:hypothetical protein